MSDFSVGVSGISTVNPLGSTHSTTFVKNFLIAGLDPTSGRPL